MNENCSGNILIEFADHLTQFVSINKEVPYIKNETRYKLDQTKFDEKAFLDDLSIQKFEELGNPNERFSDLIWKYEATVKRHMPLKKVTNKEKKMNNKPWISKEILKKIKIRNNLFARKKQDTNNVHLKNSYNRFINSVNNDIKE